MGRVASIPLVVGKHVPVYDSFTIAEKLKVFGVVWFAIQVHKVKSCHPDAVLLLRIRADDRGARCPLGVKYGAMMCEVEGLLRVARECNVPVAGTLHSISHSFF